MKKNRPNNFCICGHEDFMHGACIGACGITLVGPDNELEDNIRHSCEEFRLDNLKYLEQVYEEKTNKN